MEVIKDYKEKIAIAHQIRTMMNDNCMAIVKRKLHKIKTATKFPIVVYEHRIFHNLGEWTFCVTVESKKRFLAGIVAICAFKIEYDKQNNMNAVLLVEGDDGGNVFIEEYEKEFLDDYAYSHELSVDNYESVYLKFYIENYFSTRKSFDGYFVCQDIKGNEHKILPFIMATPIGVAMGITNDSREGNCYIRYESASKFFGNNEDMFEKITDNMLDYMNDMEKNIWKYSPIKRQNPSPD